MTDIKLEISHKCSEIILHADLLFEGAFDLKTFDWRPYDLQWTSPEFKSLDPENTNYDIVFSIIAGGLLKQMNNPESVSHEQLIEKIKEYRRQFDSKSKIEKTTQKWAKVMCQVGAKVIMPKE